MRGGSVDPRSKGFKNQESNILKKNPSFSMAARIENNRVLREHMQKFIGADTPGVGTYDPLKETLEDKKKLKVLKRLNMYAGATRSNKGTGVYSATGPGSM